MANQKPAPKVQAKPASKTPVQPSKPANKK